MTGLTYSEEDAETAPRGHVRFAGTDVDVVTYRINETDLCVLVNKGGTCVYRAAIIYAMDPNLKPHVTPLIDDTFVIRDLAAARALVDELFGQR